MLLRGFDMLVMSFMLLLMRKQQADLWRNHATAHAVLPYVTILHGQDFHVLMLS